MMRIKISASGSLWVMLAVMMLILPLDWLFSLIMASVIHELGHFACIRLCGGNVNKLELNAGGMKMHTDMMPKGKELVCALAGPVLGLLPLLMHSVFPKLAFCAAAQSFFNLLPLYPLDGGRALLAAIAMMPIKAQKWIGKPAIILISVCVIAFVFRLLFAFKSAMLAVCILFVVRYRPILNCIDKYINNGKLRKKRKG